MPHDDFRRFRRQDLTKYTSNPFLSHAASTQYRKSNSLGDRLGKDAVFSPNHVKALDFCLGHRAILHLESRIFLLLQQW